MGLGPYIGREYAHDLVYDICRDAVASRPPAAGPARRAPGDHQAPRPRRAGQALRPGQLPRPVRGDGRPRARPAGRTAMSTGADRVVPCVLMRAGTSRGPFFLREWLPADERARDEALIGAIGASDLLQLDGVGGGSTPDQQGGHRLAVRPARLRRGLPVRPGRGRPAVGGHQPQLRQHAGGRRPVRDRAGARTGRGRHHDGARLQRQHPLAHRRRRADPRPTGHLRRRCADRRRGRDRGADPAQLPRRLGRGHRLGLPDRAAHRRHRRRRGHLPRRRHAADDRPSRRPRPHRSRDPRPARRRHRPARTAGVVAAHRRQADGAGRRVRQGHPQTGDRQRGRRPAQHHLALLHPASVPHLARRDRRHRGGHRVRPARHRGQRRHRAAGRDARHRRAAPAGPHRRAGRARGRR